jgi:hypothetical protein
MPATVFGRNSRVMSVFAGSTGIMNEIVFIKEEYAFF